jgi:hypothetical protein
MALIMREAVNNSTFTSIISSRRFDIPPTERQPEVRHLLNTNRQIHPGNFFNEWVVGGKTGWTTDAGNTLVTYANQDGRRLIACVLQGDGTGAFVDTTALLDFGFALETEYVTVFDSSAYSIAVPVFQNINGNPTEIGRVRLASDTDLSFELPPDWSHSWLRYELSVPETLAAPVEIGETLGRVAVYVQNIRVGEVTLTARDAVYAYTPPVYDESAYIPPENAPPYDESAYDEIQFFTGALSFLNNEYVLTLAIPLAISCVTLMISVIAVLTRNKRRIRKMLRMRRARFARYPHYRYK